MYSFKNNISLRSQQTNETSKLNLKKTRKIRERFRHVIWAYLVKLLIIFTSKTGDVSHIREESESKI